MNELKKIEVSVYETRFPKNNFLFFDKLTDEEKKEYLLLYSLYSNYLYNYLIQLLNLKEYDNLLKNSDKNFVVIDDDNKDLYQFLSNGFLNYIYIRNNIYLERLNEEEYKFLKNRLIANNLGYDNLAKKFIDNTYKKVILENVSDKNHVKINYGPDNYQFYQMDNALILGIRYDNYYRENNINDQEWEKESNDRELIVDIMIEMLSKTLKKNIEISSFVIKYNDFSVKPKRHDVNINNVDII